LKQEGKKKNELTTTGDKKTFQKRGSRGCTKKRYHVQRGEERLRPGRGEESKKPGQRATQLWRNDMGEEDRMDFGRKNVWHLVKVETHGGGNWEEKGGGWKPDERPRNIH